MTSISYRRGYKYQLAADYATTTAIRPAATVETTYITLTTAGELVIRAGYAWDGPSGPTWDTRSAMRGSLEHDAKYQLIRLGLIPRSWLPVADDELRDTLVDDGMARVRARYWLWGVRRFGVARPSAEPLIYRAP